MANQPHYRGHMFEFGQPFSGDVARERTARLLDGLPLDREVVRKFLHYGDKDPLPGFAPVKFYGAKAGFKVVGFGETGIDLLRLMAPQLALAWSRQVHRPVRQRVWEGTCAIEHKPFEIQLQVRKLVVHKRPTQLERFNADPETHLAGLITRSFERQLAAIGLPPEVPPVRILGYEGEFSARLGKGTAAFRGVRDVRFTLPARLTGLWALGYLSSNGYGLCDANRCNASTVERKLEEALHAVGQ